MLVLSLMVASIASAQRSPSLSLDATLGTSGGQTDGLFLSRKTQGMSGDITIVARFPSNSRRGFVVGANATAQGAVGSTDICIEKPDGTCVPGFPSFTLFGALVGWVSRDGVFRITAGPVYAVSDESGRGFGPHARLDVAMPIIRHFALVGSVRGAHVPNVNGDRFSFFALGGGIRIY